MGKTRTAMALALLLWSVCLSPVLCGGLSAAEKDGGPYRVRHIDREPDLADFDSLLWKKAEPTRWYLAGTDGPASCATDARLLWSDRYLFVRWKAMDRDIFAFHTERDARTYEDDALELFFNTDPGGDAYYNFEINALGTVYDSFQPRPVFAGGDHRWSRWDCRGLRTEVLIKGTLNDPSDEDEYWILQCAIPFEALEGKTPPRPGDVWRFLPARYDYSVYLPDKGKELSAAGLLTGSVVSFHDQKYWNDMIFTE
ncbi:MAG: carbohydrate-binding family 9-like protein [Abditibacteriota bacterium]|nr:carbohydrate-binding family 9-like protein [Abditibacteriota bacterium]